VKAQNWISSAFHISGWMGEQAGTYQGNRVLGKFFKVFNETEQNH